MTTYNQKEVDDIKASSFRSGLSWGAVISAASMFFTLVTWAVALYFLTHLQ